MTNLDYDIMTSHWGDSLLSRILCASFAHSRARVHFRYVYTQRISLYQFVIVHRYIIEKKKITIAFYYHYVQFCNGFRLWPKISIQTAIILLFEYVAVVGSCCPYPPSRVSSLLSYENARPTQLVHIRSRGLPTDDCCCA